MRSKRPCGHWPGDLSLLDPDLRQVAGALGGGLDRGRGDVAGQQGDRSAGRAAG